MLCLAAAPARAGDGELFHHHIHNFSVNHTDRGKANFADVHRHALAMKYKLVSTGRPREKKYQGLGLIKNHNALIAPVRLDIEKKKILYHPFYDGTGRLSSVRPSRKVSRWYPIDEKDLEILKQYACAKRNPSGISLATLTRQGMEKFFWPRWVRNGKMNLIANWQSRAVVDRAVEGTFAGLGQGRFDALFFDSFGAAGPGECVNSTAGGAGRYQDWWQGKVDFVSRVTQKIHQAQRDDGPGPHYVFANIWQPQGAAFGKILNLYAKKDLRLDHYYLEAGKNIKANGRDPETGLPAFTLNKGSGYLPAAIISVDTEYGWYGADADSRTMGREPYLLQHFTAAGIAAMQGSWFGWYGEDNVDKYARENGGKAGRVYDNAMQLLRVLPNWENLASVPLDKRNFDEDAKSYRSPNSYFSKEVIYAKAFDANDIFAVFLGRQGKIDRLTSAKQIEGAFFVNDLFEITTESALKCLKFTPDGTYNTCEQTYGKGIVFHAAR